MDVNKEGSDVESGSESYVSSLLGGEIRIGDGYQAIIPNEQAFYDVDELPVRLANPRQLWAPDKCSLTEPQLEEFVVTARKQSHPHHSLDQVLGMLYWHNFDRDATLLDLKQLATHPDYDVRWSDADIEQFEKLFIKHGKLFHLISKKMPHKPIGNIIKFYYVWKKTRRVDKRVFASMAWEDDDELLELSEPSRKQGKGLQRHASPVTLKEVVSAVSKTTAANKALKTIRASVATLDQEFQKVKQAVDEKRATLKFAIPEDLASLNEPNNRALAVPSSDKSNYAGESAKLEENNLDVIRQAVRLFGLKSPSVLAVYVSATLSNHYDEKELSRFIAEHATSFAEDVEAFNKAGTIAEEDKRVGVKTADNLAVPVALALKQ
eukprot:m.173442 g.173442  ORF g.173442 m.173442 type:complete len:379 (-) comp16736_c0_seq1:4409-5545(-)